MVWAIIEFKSQPILIQRSHGAWWKLLPRSWDGNMVGLKRIFWPKLLNPRSRKWMILEFIYLIYKEWTFEVHIHFLPSSSTASWFSAFRHLYSIDFSQSEIWLLFMLRFHCSTHTRHSWRVWQEHWVASIRQWFDPFVNCRTWSKLFVVWNQTIIQGSTGTTKPRYTRSLTSVQKFS